MFLLGSVSRRSNAKLMWISLFFLFFKLSGHTCAFWGPLVPLFWIYGDVFSGFQSQSGFCLIRIAEANVMYIPWDPPLVLHGDLLVASVHPVLSPHTVPSRGEVAWIRTRALRICVSQTEQFRIEGHFGFRTFWTKFYNILKYGLNLKFETIVQFFRKILQLNAVIILKSTNEYYRKIISKSGRKMDLYLAMR